MCNLCEETILRVGEWCELVKEEEKSLCGWLLPKCDQAFRKPQKVWKSRAVRMGVYKAVCESCKFHESITTCIHFLSDKLN